VEEARNALRLLENELSLADEPTRAGDLWHREQSRRMLRDFAVTAIHSPHVSRRRRRKR
jgi:hypothetical protein